MGRRLLRGTMVVLVRHERGEAWRSARPARAGNRSRRDCCRRVHHPRDTGARQSADFHQYSPKPAGPQQSITKQTFEGVSCKYSVSEFPTQGRGTTLLLDGSQIELAEPFSLDASIVVCICALDAAGTLHRSAGTVRCARGMLLDMSNVEHLQPYFPRLGAREANTNGVDWDKVGR